MDTIAYVPDPVDPQTMVNSVKGHSRFTVDSCSTMMTTQLSRYDHYDEMNNREARNFLVESLTNDLARELREVSEDNDSFPVTFLRLIQLIRSTSIDRFENLKLSIKSRKPTKYPGQDISKMASDLRADAQQLDIAGQYDHNLTLHMLDSFMEAGGSNNEDFRYPLRALKVKLGDALLAIGYMSREDARKHMASLKLNYKDICTTAVDQYRSQLDNQRWPPSRGVTDTRTPPSAFGNVAHCSPDAVAIAQADALIQQQQGPSSKGKDGNCLHCGKPGHWARDCPSKRSNGNGKPTSSGNRTRSSGPRSTSDPPTWKKIAPKPGEASTKTTDGKTWRWCGKCARWSTTHGTDQHTGPVKASKASSSNTPLSVQANTIFPMPAAWNVPFLLDPTISDVVAFGFDILKLLAVFVHRTLLLPFFAAGFAYALGSTPATFWGYCLHMFTDHWTHFLPLLF